MSCHKYKPKAWKTYRIDNCCPDFTGCTTKTAPIFNVDIQNATITQQQVIIPNGFIELTPVGILRDFMYRWSNGVTGRGSNRIADLYPGNFRVTVVDPTGCEWTYEYEILAPNPLDIVIVT